MSFNLVDLIKDQISDTVVEKAGGLLGGDAPNVASGIESAVPALLGGLAGAANTPGKAVVLFDTINKTDDSVLTNFPGALGGPHAGKMLEQGSAVLTGLMGPGTVDSLGSALSSATGMSLGGSGSIMSMLVPPILGVLKKKVVGDGLDADGLVSMLNGQKANIADAMPANLASQLGGIDGFAGLSGVADGVKDAAGNVSGAVGVAAAGLGAAAGGVAAAAGGAAGKVGDFAQGGVDAVSGAASGAAGKVGDFAQGGVDAVSGAVSGAAGKAGDFAQGGVDAVSGAASGAAGKAGDFAQGSVDAVSGAASGAVGKVGDVAQGGVDAVSGVAGKVGDAAQHGVDTASSAGGGLFKWLIPLLIALGLGWLAYTFLGKKDVDAPDVSGAATAVESAASDATAAVGSTAADATTAVQGAASDATTAVGSAASDATTAVGSTAADATAAVQGAASDATTAVGSAASDATAAVGSTAADATAAVQGAVSDATTAVGSAASDATAAVQGTASNAMSAVQSAASGAVGGLDIGGLTGNVSGMFGKASETLSGITDVDSATAALPALKELSGQVSGLPAMLDKVPAMARGPLKGAVSSGLGSLQPMIDKAMAIPGVGGILEPVLKPMMETLGGLGE